MFWLLNVLAAGEMTRTWVIPESHNVPEIHFDLREPALTGDMLGLKTWGTSYVISKKLEFIGNQYLDDLINHSTGGFRVLELGAGTGLVRSGLPQAVLMPKPAPSFF